MDAEALLRHLADGRSHSGQALARAFGVTRAAVWKQVGKLKEWGIAVEGTAGRGYRVDPPIDLLDARVIAERVSTARDVRVETLEIFWEHASTNRYLQEQPPPEPGALRVCLAEYQSAGRGRRGRSWNSPLGAGVCLSASWQFSEAPRDLSALTLAIGVVARRAIKAAAGVEAELKWPNDLVIAGRKLGGILVELSLEAQGSCHVVAGLGVNVAMAPRKLASVGDWPQGAIDLASATDGAPPSRSELAALLIAELGRLFASFARTGFAPYREEFGAADCLRDRRVEIDDGVRKTVGTARGIGTDGSLLVALPGGAERRVLSGDVSVRQPA